MVDNAIKMCIDKVYLFKFKFFNEENTPKE